jgi:CRISPR-associated exonuclease Cas4
LEPCKIFLACPVYNPQVDALYVVELRSGFADSHSIKNEMIINFVPVSKLPEYPHPNDLLYTNASMFIFDIQGGFIVYFTPEGKFIEFSVSESKRMFEQVVRRARILYLLLKEKKTPVVEPSELCFSCKYFQRCFGQQKESEHLADILGIGKKK